METIHAPWRLAYIQSLETKGQGPTCGCFLCDAATTSSDDLVISRKRLLLWQSEHCVCVINRYPYTSGHLMVAPKNHKADLDQLDPAELADLNVQTVRAIAIIRLAMHPQGFNIGINMGTAAGAGIPGHLHQHVIARWAGDVNFISVVGDVRIVPHATDVLWETLRKLMTE